MFLCVLSRLLLCRSHVPLDAIPSEKASLSFCSVWKNGAYPSAEWGYLPIAPKGYSSVFQTSRRERNSTYCGAFLYRNPSLCPKRVTKNPSGHVFVKNYDLRIP